MTSDSTPDERGTPSWWIPLDDRTLGVVGAIIGFAILILTSTQVTESSALIVGTDSPFLQGGFFPRVVGGFIAACGLFLFVSEIVRVRKGNVSPWPLAQLTGRMVLGSMLFLIAVGVTVAVTALAGFRLAMVLVSAPLSRWFGAPTWFHAIGVSLALALVVFYLFTLLLKVPLPSPLF